MTFPILNYNFDGPHTTTNPLKNQSGVYVILDCGFKGNSVLDVGESQNIKYRVENHDRAGCWSSNCSGTMKVAALYTNEVNRMKIEKAIRAKYNPTCGVF